MLEYFQSCIPEPDTRVGKLGRVTKYCYDHLHTHHWRQRDKICALLYLQFTSNAERILNVIRRHWSIENKLHWVLDVALNKDHSRVCKDQAPENFAVLRHIALNLLKLEKTAKGDIHAKQLQAGWKEDYLLKVLASGI